MATGSSRTTSPAAMPNKRMDAPIKRVSVCILGALREAAPGKIGADGACAQHVLVLAGNQENGAPYVVGEMIASGSGASISSDGVAVIATDATLCSSCARGACAPMHIRAHSWQLTDDVGARRRARTRQDLPDAEEEQWALWWQAWNDTTGEELDAQGVIGARKLEMEYIASKQVCKQVNKRASK